MLHGHNYQVKVSIEVPERLDINEEGFFIDFKVFKTFIRKELDKWDEHVLLPAKQIDMKFEEKDKSLHVWFRDRYYVFPKNEVVLLDITNTSVEQLSRILAEIFLKEFSKYKVEKIRVTVEETRGQAASVSLSY